MSPISEQAQASVAQKIVRYLQRNPKSEDTFPGILHWWLLDQNIHEAEQEVRLALEQLVDDGRIVKRQGRDGQIRYRLNPAHA